MHSKNKSRVQLTAESMQHRCDRDTFWFKGHHDKAKQMLIRRVPAIFYCLLSVCGSCREGDQLINWVTGLRRDNRMQIESGSPRRHPRSVCSPISTQGDGSLPFFSIKAPV